MTHRRPSPLAIVLPVTLAALLVLPARAQVTPAPPPRPAPPATGAPAAAQVAAPAAAPVAAPADTVRAILRPRVPLPAESASSGVTRFSFIVS